MSRTRNSTKALQRSPLPRRCELALFPSLPFPRSERLSGVAPAYAPASGTPAWAGGSSDFRPSASALVGAVYLTTPSWLIELPSATFS